MLPISNNGPLVSIGMPTYNGERFIRKAIDSLLSQEYKNFELIISDNASTDKTKQIINEYGTLDNRVKIIIQDYNIGILSNFKIVLKLARGNYFMWAADDDYWMPGFISSLIEKLEKHKENGVAMCAVERVYEDGTFMDTIQFKNKDNPNNMTYYQMLKGLTSPKKYNLYYYGIFRTMLLKEAITFHPEVPGLDRLFLCQMALATKFYYYDKILHRRMEHFQPSIVRLSDEKFNKMQKYKFHNINILITLGKMILKSTIIPWHRKLYVPIAMYRILWLQVLSMIFVNIKKRISPSTHKRLKLIKRKYF